MIRTFCLFFSVHIFFLISLHSQNQEIIRLNPEEVEKMFIEHNLILLAEKLNIDIADATIAQAKLWDNPSLSVTDISFWSTKSQRNGEDEIIPPMFGSFGKNTEFSVELSQLIQTAGKRRKLINVGKSSKEIAIQQFEDVLRGLKIELRRFIYDIVYTESYQKVLRSQKELLEKLIESYQKQQTQKNISKTELFRLQSALFDLENEESEVQIELNGLQKELKSLLHIDSWVNLEIMNNEKTFKNPQELSLADLMNTAVDNRPDIKLLHLQTEYFKKSWLYEKAQRSPDITLSINYDRYGGVWKNFVGVGISVDLPVVNRNQGGIKIAKISQEQSEYLAQQQQKMAQYEVEEAFQNYSLAYNFHKKISENALFSELDQMLEIYAKNLLDKNIGMIEYIDFMNAYKSNKQTILSTTRNLSTQFEELQYTVGTEIK